MNIFIDESGTFSIPDSETQSLSIIGALAIQDDCYYSFLKTFKRIRNAVGVNTDEVKGNKLDNRQLLDFVNGFSSFPLLYDFVLIDLTYEIDANILSHKNNQAMLLLDTIGPDFSKATTDFLKNLASNINALSNQLYIQMHLLTDLMEKIIRRSTLYYCQRSPVSLARFNFFIDAKDAKITRYERLWLDIYKAFLQMRGMASPLLQLDGGDYSFFKYFENSKQDFPKYLEEYYKFVPAPSIDINKIFENVKFLNSKMSLGLQAVDLLANATKRVLTARANSDLLRALRSIIIQQENNTLSVSRLSNIGKLHPNTAFYGRRLVGQYNRAMIDKKSISNM
jgi:hypothetical protein